MARDTGTEQNYWNDKKSDKNQICWESEELKNVGFFRNVLGWDIGSNNCFYSGYSTTDI